jgi:predicted RNA-binding Zn ribbon-like protein
MATDERDRRLAAPGELELVRDFVNTHDLERGTDRIADPSGLSAWLDERGLVPEEPELTRDDVRRARDLREALRAMLLANAGFPLPSRALEEFNEAVNSARLRVETNDAGHLALLSTEPGLDHAIGRFLSAVLAAQENGTWSRLKACGGDGCHWALYDHTRNRSASWCDSRKCGARIRSRRYRRRRREPSK